MNRRYLPPLFLTLLSTNPVSMSYASEVDLYDDLPRPSTIISEIPNAFAYVYYLNGRKGTIEGGAGTDAQIPEIFFKPPKREKNPFENERVQLAHENLVDGMRQTIITDSQKIDGKEFSIKDTDISFTLDNYNMSGEYFPIKINLPKAAKTITTERLAAAYGIDPIKMDYGKPRFIWEVSSSLGKPFRLYIEKSRAEKFWEENNGKLSVDAVLRFSYLDPDFSWGRRNLLIKLKPIRLRISSLGIECGIEPIVEKHTLYQTTVGYRCKSPQP